MRRARRLLVASTAVIAAAAIGDGASVAADARPRALGALLTGATEVPNPGDPDGAGLAGVFVNPSRGRLCYAVGVAHIAPATLAHIHRGAAGTPGPVVVNFIAPTDGFSAECVKVDTVLAADIARNPQNFYVNVHNADHPTGAVRGQLG